MALEETGIVIWDQSFFQRASDIYWSLTVQFSPGVKLVSFLCDYWTFGVACTVAYPVMYNCEFLSVNCLVPAYLEDLGM
jgi:hypothetical protein